MTTSFTQNDNFVQPGHFECHFMNLLSVTLQLSSQLKINHVIQEPTKAN